MLRSPRRGFRFPRRGHCGRGAGRIRAVLGGRGSRRSAHSPECSGRRVHACRWSTGPGPPGVLGEGRRRGAGSPRGRRGPGLVEHGGSAELAGHGRRESLLRAAADQSQSDTVEDELFRLGRIVAGNPQLEQVLSDRSTPVAAKRELLSKLLYGKVTAITEALAIQAVGRLRTAPADAFDELSALAAALRDKAVAHVRSASTLSSEQVERLAATLTRTYGKPVTVHVEVDPALLSGMVVRVATRSSTGARPVASLPCARPSSSRRPNTYSRSFRRPDTESRKTWRS